MTTTLGPPSMGRRVVPTLGVALILAGLSLLAYIAWQYIGTNIVSAQRQEAVKQDIARDWGKEVDGDVPETLRDGDVFETLREGDAIGLLRVERFGEDYEAPIVKGFSDDSLASGVGWDPKSADPGQTGNFAIAGHRVTHGQLFSEFPELKRGDLVVVETRTKIYTYKLRNNGTSITVDFTVGWPLQPVPDPKAAGERPTQSVMAMVTCAELFHTRNRSVVIGDLITTVDKVTPPNATA